MRYRNSFARLILKFVTEQDNGKMFKCLVTQVMNNGSILTLTKTFEIAVSSMLIIYITTILY